MARQSRRKARSRRRQGGVQQGPCRAHWHKQAPELTSAALRRARARNQHQHGQGAQLYMPQCERSSRLTLCVAGRLRPELPGLEVAGVFKVQLIYVCM